MIKYKIYNCPKCKEDFSLQSWWAPDEKELDQWCPVWSSN